MSGKWKNRQLQRKIKLVLEYKLICYNTYKDDYEVGTGLSLTYEEREKKINMIRILSKVQNICNSFTQIPIKHIKN
jgi:hypothetical protein